jgi:integrase
LGLILKYVERKASGRIDFRRVYPTKLRPYIQGEPRELKLSLGREDEPEFLTKYQEALRTYERNILSATNRLEGRYDELTPDKLAHLKSALYQQWLEEDEECRFSSDDLSFYESVSDDLQTREIGHKSTFRDRTDDRFYIKAKINAEDNLATYKGWRGRGLIKAMVDHWTEDGEELCGIAGYNLNLSSTPNVERICRALNDAAISALEGILKRFEGEDIPTPTQTLSPFDEPPEEVYAPTKRAAKAKPILSLPDLYDRYAEVAGIKAATHRDGKRHIDKLCTFASTTNSHDISEDTLFAWRDHLLSEPSEKGGQRGAVTVRKYIATVRACLKWAVEERLLETNVADKINVRVPKRVRLRNPEFNNDEAIAILRATLKPIPEGTRPCVARAIRWIPWLCAFTGARVNEIAQLRREDLMQVDGIWAIRITPEAGSVKTSTARTVPLHSQIIEQGFIDVVQRLPEGPAFYDPSRRKTNDDPANRYVKKVGERLAEFVRSDAGISDPNVQPNHGWRHKFKSLAYEHDIEERIADAIQGHAPKSAGQNYGSITLKAMAMAIAKLPNFPCPPIHYKRAGKENCAYGQYGDR